MCQFHTWVHDIENGYVIECMHCKKMQVCFGNVAVTLYSEQFDQLLKYVGSLWEYHQPLQDNDVKTVVLKTSCDGLNFLLSEKELACLFKMLETADNERKVSQLMTLF